MRKTIKTHKRGLTPVFEPCEEGGFHCFIKESPGIQSEGDTLEEAQQNLLDAFGTFLSYRLEKLSNRLDKEIRQRAQQIDAPKGSSKHRQFRPKLLPAWSFSS
jgi:predicted RNase H-like HicB family nuclease